MPVAADTVAAPDLPQKVEQPGSTCQSVCETRARTLLAILCLCASPCAHGPVCLGAPDNLWRII